MASKPQTTTENKKNSTAASTSTTSSTSTGSSISTSAPSWPGDSYSRPLTRAELANIKPALHSPVLAPWQIEGYEILQEFNIVDWDQTESKLVKERSVSPGGIVFVDEEGVEGKGVKLDTLSKVSLEKQKKEKEKKEKKGPVRHFLEFCGKQDKE